MNFICNARMPKSRLRSVSLYRGAESDMGIASVSRCCWASARTALAFSGPAIASWMASRYSPRLSK
jgi:hypothetical protein